MKNIRIIAQVLEIIEDKKAQDIVVLDISEVSSFTDFFILCSGTSSRQNHALADALQEKLGAQGVKPSHLEGYSRGDWILMDYLDFVVHIFSPVSRAFYDLERLWRDGQRMDPAQVRKAARKRPARSRSGEAPAAIDQAAE